MVGRFSSLISSLTNTIQILFRMNSCPQSRGTQYPVSSTKYWYRFLSLSLSHSPTLPLCLSGSPRKTLTLDFPTPKLRRDKASRKLCRSVCRMKQHHVSVAFCIIDGSSPDLLTTKRRIRYSDAQSNLVFSLWHKETWLSFKWKEPPRRRHGRPHSSCQRVGKFLRL